MARVVKCIKPAAGLEVGKLYEVSCDAYDLIHVGGEHDGHSRDCFEYVRAVSALPHQWYEVVKRDDETFEYIIPSYGRTWDHSNNNTFTWSELPTETPEQHPLTKYARKSTIGIPFERLSQLAQLESGGVKHDGDKLKPTLLLDDMPLAIQEMLKVLKHGADKYAEGNWLKVNDGVNRYRNACDRHRLQSSIEEYDSESGFLHLAHEAVNAVMLLELVLRSKEVK